MPTESLRTPDFETYPTDRRVTGATTAGRAVILTWDDGLETRHHAVELRLASPDAATTHQETREPMLTLLDLPDDLRAARAEPDADGGARVLWSSGEESLFDAGWLRSVADATRGARPGPQDPPAPRAWPSADGFQPAVIDGPAALADSDAFRAVAEALIVDGAALLRGLPPEPESLDAVAAKLGPLRATDFGAYFDVVARPDATSNAYTGLALTAHTDLATRARPPGLQHLLCIENSADGGDSVLVDGMAALARLRAEAPEDARILTETPLRWTNRSRTSAYTHVAPVFELDETGALDTLRWTYWLLTPSRRAPEETEALVRALRRFAALLEAPELRVTLRLEPGDLLAFDNLRVLHGRTAYDPSSGSRRLRGCYGEREDLVSTWRVLQRAFGAAPN